MLFSSVAQAVLWRHKVRQAHDRLLAGLEWWQNCGLVFTIRRNGSSIRAANPLTVHKQHMKRAGLQER